MNCFGNQYFFLIGKKRSLRTETMDQNRGFSKKKCVFAVFFSGPRQKEAERRLKPRLKKAEKPLGITRFKP